MRNSALWKILLPAVVGLWPMVRAAAQQGPVEPAAEPAPEQQVIQPDVDRRDVKRLHIPNNNYELGLFTGTYSSENFGSNLVGGVRLGYHITEDFFAEAVYGSTHVTDETFRQILPGGIFPKQEEKLSYYNVSFGFNVLPGEVFFWKTTARPTALYLIAGLGSTKLFDQRHFSANAGFGVRVWLANWAALQADMRDHIYTVDILGQQRSTQNLEFTGGVTFYF